MTTSELVWGSLWRGAASGLGAGGLLGGLYGGLLFPITLAVEAILGTADARQAAPSGPEVLGATLGVFGFGAVYGAALGATIGLGMGVATGLAAGLVTRAWFFRSAEAGRHRWALGLAVVIVTVLVAGRLFAEVRFNPGWTDSPIADLVLFSSLPTLIAGLANWWISGRIAAWWALEPGVATPPPRGRAPVPWPPRRRPGTVPARLTESLPLLVLILGVLAN